MTASSLWLCASTEFCALCWNTCFLRPSCWSLASHCTQLHHGWRSLKFQWLFLPSCSDALPPFDLNKKDNMCVRHVVPTTVQGWSRTKGQCCSLSGTCLLMCMMDCAILVYSEALKSLDTDLRHQPSLICQLLSPNSHQNPQGFTLYALWLALFVSSVLICLSCFTSDLPFFPYGILLLILLI